MERRYSRLQQVRPQRTGQLRLHLADLRLDGQQQPALTADARLLLRRSDQRRCNHVLEQVLGTDDASARGQLSYNVNKQFMVGASYLDDINDQILDWNTNVCSLTGLAPSPTGAHAGACQQYSAGRLSYRRLRTATPVPVLSRPRTSTFRGFAVRALPRRDRKSPSVARGRGSYRFGNDPNTGASWKQPFAVWVQGKIVRTIQRRTGRILKPAISARDITHSRRTARSPTEPAMTTNIKERRGYALGYVGLHYCSANSAASASSIRRPTS